MIGILFVTVETSLLLGILREMLDRAALFCLPFFNQCSYLTVSEPARVPYIVYVDDLVLLNGTQDKLQSLVGLLAEYVDHKQSAVNVTKCQVMCFDQGRNCVMLSLVYKGKAI